MPTAKMTSAKTNITIVETMAKQWEPHDENVDEDIKKKSQ